MAEFATIADMQTRFREQDLIELTDGDGAIDEVAMEAKLVSASNIVRGHVAAHYDSAAFPAMPPLLVDLACDIALYRLYQTAVPEEVKDRYKDAIRQLESIAKGILKLDEGSAPMEQRAGAIHVEGERRRFSRTSMSGY